PLARVLDATDVATHKAAAAGAGASLDPALFVPVLGVGALAFGAGALVLIALIVAGRAARVAAAATAVTLLATLPCVALRLAAAWTGGARVWVVTGRAEDRSAVGMLPGRHLIASAGGRRLYVNR